ncbi:MAG: flagellar basal body-associated FliL family protein [Gammaproteobacteria bacterium]|nr:flagellar basal body-associated FliL family protein [Gammaproteobacteria bacterium]
MAEKNAPVVEEEEEGGKKGGMLKMMIIIIVIIILVGGAAAGVYFFMKSQLDSAQAELQEAQARLEDEMAPKKEELGEPIYLEFDPEFTLNIMGEQQEHYLTVGVSVLTYSQDTFDALNVYRPMLRNSLVIMMADARYEDLLAPEGKERLRDMAKQTITEVMDDNSQSVEIADLYFTKFLMQ